MIYVKQSSGTTLLDKDFTSTINSMKTDIASLKNSKLSYTSLTSTRNGVITAGSLWIVYGVFPFNSFTSHSNSGGYHTIIDLTSYKFLKPLYGNVAAQYPSGKPLCTMGVIDASQIQLLCDVNVKNGYAMWIVIGSHN